MTHIIGLVQVKGGAGRSTIATNLAGMLAAKKRVALIDCDMPQGSSASWAAVRKQQYQEGGKLEWNKKYEEGRFYLGTATDHMQLKAEVERLKPNCDLIVIDAPPRIAEITGATLILADLCLVPIGASLADIWATSDLLNTIEQAKTHKPNVQARILWNKYRTTTKSARELSEAVKEQLGLKEMGSRLGYRVAYSDAFGEGMTVMEWTDKAAKDEMKMLEVELAHLLKIRL